GEQDLFYTSGSNGKFSIADSQHASVWTHNVAVADINSDGFDDVFSASILAGKDDSGVERSFLALSDGHGGFTVDQARLPRLVVNQDTTYDWPRPSYVDKSGATITYGSTFTGSAMLDANGDGYADLVVLANSMARAGRIFFNDGAGYFSDARSAELPEGSYGYGGIDANGEYKGTI